MIKFVTNPKQTAAVKSYKRAADRLHRLGMGIRLNDTDCDIFKDLGPVDGLSMPGIKIKSKAFKKGNIEITTMRLILPETKEK